MGFPYRRNPFTGNYEPDFENMTPEELDEFYAGAIDDAYEREECCFNESLRN